MKDTPKSDMAQCRVLALTAALFLSYLTVAMSLPAVPIHVVHNLKLGNVYAGLAVGVAFISTILTRGWAGSWSDRIGGKLAMQRGLLIYAGAGLICFLASMPNLAVTWSYTILIVGRLLLGLGESVAMVGMMGWAIGLMGSMQSGRVISLVGMGMYGAFAIGGPLGLLLLDCFGLAGLMTACTVLPLIGLLTIHWIPDVELQVGPRESFWRIIARIWRHGTVVCLQGIGFAALGAFFSLYFISRGWEYAGLGLTFFGTGFVLIRLLCSHLPDKIGGTKIAAASLLVEACGQYLLWLAPNPYAAFAGAFLTGIGCSMVFPSMGAEVIKRIPPHLRGTAIGGFAAFQDLAYGATAPLVGILADRTGYSSVFLIGGLAATAGICIVLSMRNDTLSLNVQSEGS